MKTSLVLTCYQFKTSKPSGCITPRLHSSPKFYKSGIPLRHVFKLSSSPQFLDVSHRLVNRFNDKLCEHSVCDTVEFFDAVSSFNVSKMLELLFLRGYCHRMSSISPMHADGEYDRH
ncbi:unnamed protein product [Heterobilharzia americana]|nr:unnamed protein product [Heterobilharzia americana]